MVVHRRGALMGVVAITALALSVGYLWRFGDDHGIVPFLLGGALVIIAVVHGIAWRQSRLALMIADMTGLQVRLGGGWAGLPWSDVERIDVAGRGRIGDGRLTVVPRDERRTLADAGLRTRLAVMVNRWLYDAALVVPYGVTTRVSVDDITGSLRRLADGRAPVVVLDDRVAEPTPTVEVTPTRVAPDPVVQPLPDVTIPPRRLAAVVSALRSQATRRDEATVPIRLEPATSGTLALSDHLLEETEPLPELQELRRRAPEDQENDRSTHTSNVELIIEATTDLSARAMRKVRQRPDPVSEASPAHDVAEPTGRLARSPYDGSTLGNEAIGAQIRAAREWLGTTVDELAERTRIRPFVIESIEIGDFSPCGGDFYARGHLRMLAGVLGIDPTPILASYDEHVAVAPVSPRAVFDAELSKGVLRPTGGGSRWGALIGTVLVLLLAWGVARFFFSAPSYAANSVAPPAVNSAPLRPPSINDPSIGGSLPAAGTPVHVTLTATGGTSFVVVRDSSMKIIYQGTLQNGQSAGISGQGSLRVMAADGGAVSLSALGHPEAPMGLPGQRAFRRISAPS